MTACCGRAENGVHMVEFFSGIGGMRLGTELALKRRQKEEVEAEQDNRKSAGSNAVVRNVFEPVLDSCHAYEISLHANAVYKHNFDNDADGSQKSKHSALHTKLVEQLKPETFPSPKVLHKNNHTLWTMSPPCQPFTSTRGGKLLDCDDKRCNGLKGILRLLTALRDDQKPRWIFLENVKGFYQSRMLEQVYECLRQNGYTWQEYLISPIQLGIPNHRLRYYLLCERSDRFKALDNGIQTTLPESCAYSQIKQRPLSEFLEPLSLEESRPFLVPDNSLQQDWAKDLSIVTGSSTQTYCFTAAYSRVLHKATGSLVLVNHDPSAATATGITINTNDNNCDQKSGIDSMMRFPNKIRRFSPRELLNLFGFSNDFDFPPNNNVSLEHQYKLIGNSVNVSVVSALIYELLFAS